VPQRSRNISYDESKNPFAKDNFSTDSETPRITPKSKEPPSDSSDSDGTLNSSEPGNGPPKPFAELSKGAPVISNVSKDKSDTYRFSMKLKPESIPALDGNEDSLARWMEKVGQVANISPDIFKELGMIIPRRFTGSAENWYFSINLKTR